MCKYFGKLLFLWVKCPRVQSLACVIFACPVYEKLPNCFPEWRYNFTFPVQEGSSFHVPDSISCRYLGPGPVSCHRCSPETKLCAGLARSLLRIPRVQTTERYQHLYSPQHVAWQMFSTDFLSIQQVTLFWNLFLVLFLLSSLWCLKASLFSLIKYETPASI